MQCPTFKLLLNELHNTSPQPNPKYYRTLLENSSLILQEVHMRNQGVVAKDLNINHTKFNSIIPILREISYAS